MVHLCGRSAEEEAKATWNVYVTRVEGTFPGSMTLTLLPAGSRGNSGVGKQGSRGIPMSLYVREL